MSSATFGDDRPRIPRAIAGAIIGAIALASLASLLWPSLPFNRGFIGRTEVNLIVEQIEDPDAGGVVGSPAPDFRWITPDGDLRALSDLRGAPVVLNFWATWCVPCLEEMPALDRVARSDPSARILAVAFQEDGGRIRSFFDRLALQRLEPMLDQDSRTAMRYGVVALPITFFVDRAGVIRHVEYGGPMTEDSIRAGLATAR